MKLTLDRSLYGDESTLGELSVDGKFECISLEDELAINGSKVPGKTCIPDGSYQILITWSPKFHRDLPLLIDVPGFDGIRIHPGNTVEDTAGCLLVGENYQVIAGKPFLMQSLQAFDRLFAKMFCAKRDGESISIQVTP